MKHSDKLKIAFGIALTGSVITAAPLNAQVLVDNFDDGTWSVITEDENGTTPGGGGQAFDAEYLVYKIDGNILSIGLQSGFDLITGEQDLNSKDYWAGDLALSFDGIVTGDATAMANSYEYGIDFGLYTADYGGIAVGGEPGTPGVDDAGVYSDPVWDNDIYYSSAASPFAMDSGTFETGLITNESGSEDDSFYRAVSFDLTQLGLTDLSNLTMDMHWTMSCGNDFINGSGNISVPEPTLIWLLGSGLALMGFARRKKA